MALIPPFFFDCVAAVGFKKSDGKTRWVATGFLYGRRLARPIPEPSGQNSAPSFFIFFVTNHHVLKNQHEVFFRFNPLADEPAREYRANLDDLRWTPHPDPKIDVAVISIDMNGLVKDGIRAGWFDSQEHAATIAKMNDEGITEGTAVSILGFPMGLVGGMRNVVIARAGAVASTRNVSSGSHKGFLIDASIFPGNSGSPVISLPEVVAITGTKACPRSYLIGVVDAYLPYRERAVSEQTGEPRIEFVENSGLADVIPVDYIEEAIDADLKRMELLLPAPPTPK
jgi:S1-C subfamily serine protease